LDKDSQHNFKKKEMLDLNILKSIAEKTIEDLPTQKEMISDQMIITFLNLFDDDSKIKLIN